MVRYDSSLTVWILDNESKAGILSIRLILITNVDMKVYWDCWGEIFHRRGKSNKNVCFVDRASGHIYLKRNQADAHFIFSIFRQTPLHVSGVSIARHQEVHRTDKTIGTYCSF